VPIWLVFLLWRKDQQHEMLKVGFLVGVLSVITCYLWWIQDWWSPQNITGTKIGVEDFLIGFFAGGGNVFRI
jgi:hypothetical protein